MNAVLNNDFLTRLASALSLAPVAIFLAWLGGYWFAALMVAISALLYWEWTVLTKRSIHIQRDVLSGFLVVSLICAMVIQPTLWLIHLSFALIVVGWAFVVFGKLAVGWTIAGIGMASSLSLCLIYVRLLDGYNGNGFGLLIFLCFCVWSADTFAYLIGKTLKGPKLIPKVSPQKTWSGFFGGLFGASCVAAVVAYSFSLGPIAYFILISLIVGLAAQAGDLIESSIKRQFKVKDVSKLIPGHGGLLDRVDGLILAAYAFVAIYAMGLLT